MDRRPGRQPPEVVGPIAVCLGLLVCGLGIYLILSPNDPLIKEGEKRLEDLLGSKTKKTALGFSILLILGGSTGTAIFRDRAGEVWTGYDQGVWEDTWGIALGIGLCVDVALIGVLSVVALVWRQEFKRNKWTLFLPGSLLILVGALSGSIVQSIVVTKETFHMGWVWSEYYWPTIGLLCFGLGLLGAVMVFFPLVWDWPSIWWEYHQKPSGYIKCPNCVVENARSRKHCLFCRTPLQ